MYHNQIVLALDVLLPEVSTCWHAEISNAALLWRAHLIVISVVLKSFFHVADELRN